MSLSISLVEFKCGRCHQVFKNENPFVAHCRFLCAQAKCNTWSREVHEHNEHVDAKRQRRVTDFHNLARELEQKTSGEDEDAAGSPRKRKSEDALLPKWRKGVLLEKNNMSEDEAQAVKEHEQAPGVSSSSSSSGKLKAERVKAVRARSADLADGGEARGTFTHGAKGDTHLETGEGSGVRSSSSSAFSVVLSRSQGAQRSAFCKPSKRSVPVEPQARVISAPTAPSSRLDELAEGFTSRTVLGYNNLMATSILSADVHSSVPLSNAFHYAPEHWSRSFGAQLQTTSSLTVLPPTFTSFGVSVQNWCAKCNLSFRMTSDLVFHMRSHHKKEFAAESQVRRRREEKLTCPICHEYFRERHHLSRHMTSHN